MIIPGNISMIDNDVVKLEIVPFSIANMKYLDFSWKVVKFTNNYLDIQLTFEKPLFVSSTGSIRDKLKLTLMNNVFFMSRASFKRVAPDEVLIA